MAILRRSRCADRVEIRAAMAAKYAAVEAVKAVLLDLGPGASAMWAAAVERHAVELPPDDYWPTDPDELQALVQASAGPRLIAWLEGDDDGTGPLPPTCSNGHPLRLSTAAKRYLTLTYAPDPEAGPDEYGR